MPYLLHRSGGAQAQLNEVAGTTLRIGRGTGAELRFDDAAVALEHAVIEEVAGGYRLRDLGSVTGTWHNGARIDAPVTLAGGDEIEIGPYRLKAQHAEPEDPLFLHIARVEQADEADAALVDQLIAERSGELPVAESTTTPAAPRPAAPAPAERLEAPSYDYVRAFRLERGLLRKGLLAAVASVLAAGTLFAVTVVGQRREGLSPGPLAPKHVDVACASCHPGFRRVATASCASARCHADEGGHHETRLTTAAATGDAACTTCHTEHRGVDALRRLGDGGCVGCHGALPLAAGAEPRYADGIRGFPGSHPEFAIELDDGRRLRLDREEARRADPGALKFNHRWHLTSDLIRRKHPALTCASCHTEDDKGEIAPVLFETACRDCHELVFDGRFASAEKNRAPHATPAAILEQAGGRYVLEPRILERISPAERAFLRGNLTRRQQLDELARFNVAALLQKNCVTCHVLEPAVPTPRAVEEVTVAPTLVRASWLPHARFLHAPHLRIEMECAECHGDVAASSSSDDVLLPSVAACGECHRPASLAERRADERLADDACLECHDYHAPRRTRATVARLGEVAP